MSKGRIFIVSGPSGVGKSTILDMAKARHDFYFSVSVTTRGPRPGETEDREYHFNFNRADFERMKAAGELLEYAEVFESGDCYGTPLRPVLDNLEAGRDILLDIDVQGMRQVKAVMPEAVTVFIAPPDLDELEHRLRDRNTETEEKIIKRLNTARKELEAADEYDYVIINDDRTRAADEFMAIVEPLD